jgi:excisionase family DNA binding protein
MPQKLMSASDFATTLGVTLSCVRRWIREKRISAVKLGRLVRIPIAEVERILNAGVRPATRRRP